MTGAIFNLAESRLVLDSVMEALRDPIREPEAEIPEEDKWDIDHHNKIQIFEDSMVMYPSVEETIEFGNLSPPKIIMPDYESSWTRQHRFIIKPVDSIDQIFVVYDIILISHECDKWFLNKQLGIYQPRREWSYPFEIHVDIENFGEEIELHEWCKEQCDFAWACHPDNEDPSFSFNNEAESILFKLAWG